MEDDDLAQADEWVIIHEMVLTSLMKRKALLTKQREGMEHRLLGHRDDLMSLQSKQASIQHTRMKHVQLQMELEQQLRKTEEKLKQFGVNSIDHVSNPHQSADDVPEIGHDQTIAKASTTTTMGITSRDVSDGEILPDHHGIQFPKTQEVLPSTSKKRKAESNASLFTAKIENPFAGKKGWLSPFQTNPSRNCLSLYRMLDGTRLEQLMELAVQDQISMDEGDKISEARYRRQGLFHTCLLPFAVVWENDKTVELGLNEELDPDTPICPYELAGECADPFCVFQHLKTRKVESQRLIKELLPLPDLQLPVPAHRNRQDNCSNEGENHLTEKKQRLDPLACAEFLIDTPKPTESAHETMDGFLLAEPSIPSTTTFLDSSDDFITLPPENHTPNEGRNTLMQIRTRRPRSWWMGVDDKDEIGSLRNGGPQLTVIAWMRTMHRLDVEDGTLVCQEPYQKIDDRDVLRLAGRLISAIQLSLHSGRYDLVNAVCLMLTDVCRTHDNVFPTQHLHPFLASLGHSWQINNQSRSVFEVAMEQQVTLSCISIFLSIIHEHKSQCLLSDYRDDPEYGRTWHDVLARIMEIPSSNAMTASEFQESCRIRANKRELNDGTFPSCVTAKRMLALAEMVLKIEMAKGATFNSMTVTDLVTLLDNNIYTSNDLSDPMVSVGSIAQIGLFVNSIELAMGKEGATVKLASTLQDKLDSLSSWICEHCDGQGIDLHLLSTPILAFRICLLISIRRYDKAQYALQEYLGSKVCVYSVSDLLWSQLVMLRSRFPTHKDMLGRSQHGTTPRKLCDTVTNFGVKLNYFTLVGDRMLFLPFLRSEIAKKRRMKLKATISIFVSRIENDATNGESMSPLIDTMDLESMPLGAYASYPGSLISLSSLTFPRSLLHGGYTLRRLKLTNCEIETLPERFGNYFPNLQELMIDQNRLTKLPPSFGNLASLMKLNVSSNKLVTVPATLGQCSMLEELILQDNQLSSLPDGIRNCYKLMHLDLANNLFMHRPDDFVVHMDSLAYLDLQGNPCTLGR